MPMHGQSEPNAAAFPRPARATVSRGLQWSIRLSLALVLGLVAASVAWKLVPAPYTAFTEIRLRSKVPSLPLQSSNRTPDFELLKQTHMQLVCNRDVLETALRAEGIGGLPFFRRQDDDQVESLQRRLEIKSIGKEFFRISLSGKDPAELKKIVIAVTQAYARVVVSAERSAIDERIKRYEKILAKEDAKLQGLREGLQLLAKDDATNSSAFVERQRAIREERSRLRQQIDEFERMIMNLEIIKNLEMKPEYRSRLIKRIMGLANGDDVPLDLELIVLKKQRSETQKQLGRLKVEQSAAGLNDVQLEMQMERIQTQKVYTQALKDEIARMRAQVELGAAEPRVIVPDRAEVSSRPDTTEKHRMTAVAGGGTFGFVLAVLLLLDVRRASARRKLNSAQHS